MTAAYLEFAETVFVPPRRGTRVTAGSRLQILTTGGFTTAREEKFAGEHVPDRTMYEDELLWPVVTTSRPSKLGTRAVFVVPEKGIARDNWETWAPAECILTIPYVPSTDTWVEYWQFQSTIWLPWGEVFAKVAATTGYALKPDQQLRRSDVIDVIERLFESTK